MLIDKRRFNYVTRHTIERITNYLKETLEEYDFTVKLRESDSSESFYLHIYCCHQFLKKIRISNHDPKKEEFDYDFDYDVSASFDRPGAINCHECLKQLFVSLHLPLPEQTENYDYVMDILNDLKSGKRKLGFSQNIIAEANSRPRITITKRTPNTEAIGECYVRVV
jgi:hypothetical protein